MKIIITFLILSFNYMGISADAPSQYQLGLYYEKNEAEHTKAMQYFEKSASEGYPPALNKLGEIYADALLSVDVDQDKAMHFFHLAAEQGYTEAYYNLGDMYAFGVNCDVDHRNSQKFYQLAANQSHALAKTKLKNLDTILCVIDMQPYFRTSQTNRTIENVKKAIQKSIKSQQTIIFIEYIIAEHLKEYYHTKDSYNTDIRLTDLVKNYEKTYTVYKSTDDGSCEIYEQCDTLGILPLTIKICGVNTGSCVYQTILGLRNKFDT